MELSVRIKKKWPGFTLDVDFISGQEVVGLIGASGAGKSMTLRCIAGLVKPDEGRIVLGGRVLFDSELGINIPCHERKVGLLFQNYALFPNMTVTENIGFALHNLDRTRRSELVRQMIRMVKLEDLAGRYPAELSGGQQQRVALARALAVEPQALLLDEPFSALDENLRIEMARQLMELLASYQGTTVFVTHNLEEAYRICQQMVMFSNGKVEAQGDKTQLFQTPPSRAVAQLTGCKNFSTVVKLPTASANEIFASDWGITLATGGKAPVSCKYVGLRDHDIRLASGVELLPAQANVFSAWPSFTSETPFRMTVFLTLERPSTGPGDFHLQWEVSKETWQELQNQPMPWRIFLNPDHLILLSR